jgi:hypothetical protein
MTPDFATALLEWHDFFAAVAGVSGTLVGLLFVALGLNPAIMADDSPAGLRVWAGQTFHSLLVVLVIGLAGLVPARVGDTFAYTLAFLGIQGVIKVVIDLRSTLADHDPYWTVRQTGLRFLSPGLAYAICLWLAYSVWQEDADALGWLIAVVLFLTMSAASSCLDLLKEIGVRHREKTGNSSLPTGLSD